MRLSLLLPREPFPVIFEQTLSRFLLSWTGKPYEIHWRPQTAPIGIALPLGRVLVG